MKKIILLLLISFFVHAAFSQGNRKYEKSLADSLGADDYGMKNYILVILKTGSNKTEDQKLIDSLFSGHMANIGRLADAGKLIVAGPLKKNDKTFRGIFILDVKKDEASSILETDPAIKAKLLEPEIYEWYGSAALPMYLPYHEKVQKIKM